MPLWSQLSNFCEYPPYRSLYYVASSNMAKLKQSDVGELILPADYRSIQICCMFSCLFDHFREMTLDHITCIYLLTIVCISDAGTICELENRSNIWRTKSYIPMRRLATCGIALICANLCQKYYPCIVSNIVGARANTMLSFKVGICLYWTFPKPSYQQKKNSSGFWNAPESAVLEKQI